MRTVIVVIYLILYYIFSIPAWFVGWIIGKINPDMKPRYAQTLIRRAFKDILFIAGVKTAFIYKKTGTERHISTVNSISEDDQR